MAAVIKRDINRIGTEEVEFPSVCERCLGPNPYIRMLKQPSGAECKICNRPFTVFRWKLQGGGGSGGGGRGQKTVICNSCCRSRNCCALCMLDLQFGLPTQVRDAALKLATEGRSAFARQYQAQNESRDTDLAQPSDRYGGKSESAARDLLRKLARSKPYARADDTSDEARETSSPAHQIEAPRSEGQSDLTPPEDQSITSLFLLGVEDDLPEHAIRAFFAPHGTIKALVCSHRSKCAYVNFAKRAAAERAAEACRGGRIAIRGNLLKVQWGKPRQLSGYHIENKNKQMVDRQLGRDRRGASSADRDGEEPDEE